MRILSEGCLAGRRIAGVTLLEVVVAITILVLGFLALAASMYYSTSARQAGRDVALAYNAARQQLERLRGEAFNELYARYNADSADDPGGPGTAPGPDFDVPGLAAPSGRRVGRISFPEDGSPLTLREDVIDPALDMPGGKDLNQDGVIDANSRALDYRILPVRIIIEWMGGGKLQRHEVNALLTER